MHTIQSLIKDTLNREGGYVNHPADRGGPTNYGITLNTLKYYRGREVTVADIQQLTRGEAFEIYEKNYYINARVCDLPPALQPLLFDMAVNHGPSGAVKLLQEVLLAHGKATKVDGRIGPTTALACQTSFDELGNDLIRHIVERRIAFYHAIVKHDPSQSAFISGWVRRAEEFLPENATCAD
ncbi:glycoside hydrolase family 108 protein [Methylomonas sp. CM2]|uniref:glycoside hydrolase family 108 protein n=1 Tax=Methylomonas sp. CM2 TaxID=3417647 RepID=UPI003CEE39AA